ncbi:MAG: hypothetical protein M3493_09290 [Actinomycetota bacterium]|jgi:hypothetical protein|nr:hypothetical protein [Euzebyaceae bacterium]MDQ3452868.1 hypothetical protein [Actinomycetota bacterium]
MATPEAMTATVLLALLLGLVLALYRSHVAVKPQLLRIRREPNLQERAAAARRAAEYEG